LQRSKIYGICQTPFLPNLIEGIGNLSIAISKKNNVLTQIASLSPPLLKAVSFLDSPLKIPTKARPDTPASSQAGPVANNKEHIHNVNSRTKKPRVLPDKEFLLEHSPHVVRCTYENSVECLHPGRVYDSRPRSKNTPSEIKNSTSETAPKKKFLRARDAFATFIDDLAPITAEAFHPEEGTLRREWLYEVRPELFTKEGIMQENMLVKKQPSGMDSYFFLWLKGDPNVSNIFTKALVNCIFIRYKRIQAEIAQRKLLKGNRRRNGSGM
jgi:hypothetical protein